MCARCEYKRTYGSHGYAIKCENVVALNDLLFAGAVGWRGNDHSMCKRTQRHTIDIVLHASSNKRNTHCFWAAAAEEWKTNANSRE